MIVHSRQNDRATVWIFVINKDGFLNYINTAIILSKGIKINIDISEKCLISRTSVFGVIRIGNKALGMIRAQNDIESIIRRIYVYELLTDRVVYIAEPFLVRLIVLLTKMM